MCVTDAVSGRDVQAHLKQVSSSCERIEKATASIRAAQCDRSQSDRMSSSSSSADGSRLSDGQREMVELAATELIAAVGQLSTAVVKLA